MRHAIFTSCMLASVALLHPDAARADEGGRFSLETGADYNTGKYGGTQSTDILYVPVTGKYQDKEWTLKLTVPYLRISGPGNVVAINGLGVTGAATAANRPTRSGLGDVVMAATHSIYNGGPSGLMINLTGKVKLGTASSSKGLGTGENDYALQSELYRTTGNLTTFGSFGYRVYGSPAQYSLNNTFYGSLGGSYRFAPETYGGVLLNGGQKITATSSSRLEALLFVNHKIEKNWKSQGYLLKGFTNSVPDWGLGATVAYLF